VAKMPNPIDRHVGSRVKMRRTLLGISQEKLAGALGISFQQVQKYEKGTNRIGASRLQDIAKFLQVEPSYLFEGAPGGERAPGLGFAEENAMAYVAELLSTAEGQQLTRAFARIQDSRVRRRIVDLVIALAPPAEGEAEDPAGASSP
jgi:transcriptional regulator with XRE-family HTH domain